MGFQKDESCMQLEKGSDQLCQDEFSFLFFEKNFQTDRSEAYHQHETSDFKEKNVTNSVDTVKTSWAGY